MSYSPKRVAPHSCTAVRARGMTRFEVLGLAIDRELIRSLARKLAEHEPGASQLRALVTRFMAVTSPIKGGILAALRRSPLVEAKLDVRRARDDGRKIEV